MSRYGNPAIPIPEISSYTLKPDYISIATNTSTQSLNTLVDWNTIVSLCACLMSRILTLGLAQLDKHLAQAILTKLNNQRDLDWSS